MAKIERANGHRPTGLTHILHPALSSAPRPKREDLPFDLDKALSAVIPLTSVVPPDAFTAPILGTEREGNGVLIDEKGLVLTIGYLIAEATEVNLIIGGESVLARVVAYDYDSGFGLLLATSLLDASPLPLGDSAAVKEGDSIIIAASGGFEQSIDARVISKREFAGSWEYLLDEAIFTTPLHPNWSGAALIDKAGELVGIGSLYVEDATPGEHTVAGNMFVPIDVLKPIYEDLLTQGRAAGLPRPWLGMYAAETIDRMLVTGVAPDSPADQAGVEAGDILLSIDGEIVTGLADMYRRIWSTGVAGADIRVGVLRGGEPIDVVIRSADRYAFFKLPLNH